MKAVHIDVRGENDIRLVIGNDVVQIPSKLIRIPAVAAITLLFDIEDSGLDELIEFLFLAGKQAGRDDLREQLRPLVSSLDTSARGAIEALGDILEQLPKEE